MPGQVTMVDARVQIVYTVTLDDGTLYQDSVATSLEQLGLTRFSQLPAAVRLALRTQAQTQFAAWQQTTAAAAAHPHVPTRAELQSLLDTARATEADLQAQIAIAQ